MFFSQGSERFVLEVGAGMGPKEDQIGSCAGLDVRIKSYQLFYAVLTSFLVNNFSLPVHDGSPIHTHKREIALLFLCC